MYRNQSFSSSVKMSKMYFVRVLTHKKERRNILLWMLNHTLRAACPVVGFISDHCRLPSDTRESNKNTPLKSASIKAFVFKGIDTFTCSSIFLPSSQTVSKKSLKSPKILCLRLHQNSHQTQHCVFQPHPVFTKPQGKKYLVFQRSNRNVNTANPITWRYAADPVNSAGLAPLSQFVVAHNLMWKQPKKWMCNREDFVHITVPWWS